MNSPADNPLQMRFFKQILTLSLALDLGQCNEALSVVATVHNVGSVDLPAGLEVTFYEGTDASGLKLTPQRMAIVRELAADLATGKLSEAPLTTSP